MIFYVFIGVAWCLLAMFTLIKKIKTQAPHISADVIHAQYTVETLVMAVIAGAIFALLVGFLTGYFCGRRCHKDDDDNLPYPDTEYEYFEQRQNMNRLGTSFIYIVFRLYVRFTVFTPK